MTATSAQGVHNVRERPQGILFDLGNTLLWQEAFDTEAGTRHVLSLAHNPRGLSVEDVGSLVRELDSDLQERRERSWIEISPHAVHRLVYEPFDVTFDRPFHEIELEFWRAATRFSLTDGIIALLEELRATGLPLGVVSNSTFSSQTLAWQIEDSGLGSFFEFVMSSADYVVRKPHPKILLTAAARLGVAPEATWYVGDSPRYDVAGAHHAGMVSVLYRPRPKPPEDPAPQLEVASWTELAAAVAAA